MNINLNPYEGLTNGIILQAVKDYRDTKKKLSRGRKSTEAERMNNDCLRFFRSNWFTVLTEVDAEFLITKLGEEAEHDS